MPPSWEKKLHEHLTSCGGRDLPPAQEIVEIAFSVMILNFKYTTSKQKLYIFTKTNFQWTDERLKWDPNEFNGINVTTKHGFKIWTPNIFREGKTRSISSMCKVDSSGAVKCMPQLIFKAHCTADLSAWPRDTQTCSLGFGVWNVRKGRTKTLLNLTKTSLMIPENFTEWDITGYEVKVNDSAERQVNLSFRFERHAGALEATVIHLSVVLSVVTLLPLVLDPRRGARVCLAGFSLLCHVYFLPDLVSEVPQFSGSPPRILIYFRTSIILSAVNIAFTLVVKVMCGRVGPVPECINKKMNCFFKSYGKFMVFSRWTTESPSESKNRNDWTDFVNLINSVWVCVSVCVYTGLYCVFIPSDRSY